MKILLFALITLPVFAAAQAPKKTNTIIVKGVAFDSAVIQLLDRGFTVDKKDEKFGTIQTEYKDLTGIVHMAIFVRIKDSSAIITGKWWSKLFANQFDSNDKDLYPVAQGKMPVPKMTFNLLDEYAKSFGKDVAYEIR